MNYQDQAIKDKIESYEDVYISYDGNELYAARWWEFYPYAKQTELAVQMEAGAVYLILIFFISIISFVSATMIMGLKIAGTIMQDIESYKRAMYLGLKENDLKKIIRKQIGFIYFFPVPREAVVELLISAFLPFNLIKGGLNAAITMILYRPMVTALRRAHLIETNQTKSKTKLNAGLILIALLIITTCTLLLLSIKGA